MLFLCLEHALVPKIMLLPPAMTSLPSAENLQLHEDLRYKELNEQRRKIETDLKTLQRNLDQIDGLLLGEFDLHVLSSC